MRNDIPEQKAEVDQQYFANVALWTACDGLTRLYLLDGRKPAQREPVFCIMLLGRYEHLRSKKLYDVD